MAADLRAIDEAAAQWVQRMALPVQDSATAAAFDRWILDDPRHVDSYARIVQLWQSDGLRQALAANDVPDSAATAAPYRRWRCAALLVPAMAAAMLLLIVAPPLLRDPVPYGAPPGAMRVVALSDGSRVNLAPGARIAVRMTPWSRDVTLEHGQAFFDVAHEQMRGFAVDGGQARVRVLGTAFDIDRMEGEAVVRVYRGSVSIAAGAGRRWRLSAGSGIALRGGNATTIDGITGSRPDWADGWFDANNTPIRQLIAHLNRSATTPIRLADPVLGELQVTGRFRLSDPDDAVKAVAAIHDLNLRRDARGLVLSR